MLQLRGAFLRLFAAALGAALLTRALYTTELGGNILRLIPDRFWNWVYERFGLEGAETTENIELFLWFSLSFVVSLALVVGGISLLRKYFFRDKI